MTKLCLHFYWVALRRGSILGEHNPGKIELHTGSDGRFSPDRAVVAGAGAPLLVYQSTCPQGVLLMDTKTEARAADLMRLQGTLLNAVKPAAALLEFTLPWAKGVTHVYAAIFACMPGGNEKIG